MAKASFFGFIGLLGIVGTLLAIPNTAEQVRTRVPIIKCIWPYEMERSATKFNVAMTPFTHLDAQGRVVRDGQGAALAEQLYGLFDGTVAGVKLGETLTIQTRGPDVTCPLKGATANERSRAAAQLADDIKADVILYGVISDTVTGPRYFPEFHVAYTGFEQGQEVVGPFEMGSDIRVSLPVDEKDYKGTNHAAVVRTRALSQIVLGLAAFSRDDYARSEYYLKQTLPPETAAKGTGPTNPDQTTLLPGDGQQIVHLFLGNTYLRKAEKDSDPTLLDAAQKEYELAFQQSTGPEQPAARAKLGQANVLYARALNDLKVQQVYNEDLLNQAEQAYTDVLTLGRPARSAIPIKVDFDLGQINLLRYWILGGDDLLEKARTQFGQALAKYDAAQQQSDKELEALYRPTAASALAGLGDIAAIQQDLATAIKHYDRGVQLASPRRKVDILTAAGDHLASAGEKDRARKYYADAKDIARGILNDAALLNFVQEHEKKYLSP